MSEDTFDKESKAPSESVREAITRERNLLRRASASGEHFWVSTYPFFDTSLLLSRVRSLANLEETEDRVSDDVWANLTIFDCDGEKINSVVVGFNDRDVGIVELDPLLGGCKLESGMKYAHAVLSPMAKGVSAICRLTTQENASVVGPSFSVYPFLPGFFPISFEEGSGNYLAVVNYGDEEAIVRCRLFFGTRTPEVSIVVPGKGARFLGIEGEFPDCSERAKDKVVQAYIRLTTKSDSGLGVQLLTKSEGPRENSLFSTVA